MLENIETNVKLIADAQVGLSQRLDRMGARFEARFDKLETQVNLLAVRVGGLEVFAADGQRRLKRIEGHLQLSGASSRPRAKAGVARKRGRKS